MTDGRVLPLAGLRVVDVTVEHGELCSRLLGDLGAEVVKVEPAAGSPARALAPVRQGISLSFAVNNAGKLGVALDLADPADAERFHELLRHADVLVTSDADARTGPVGRRSSPTPTRTWSSPRPRPTASPVRGPVGSPPTRCCRPPVA